MGSEHKTFADFERPAVADDVGPVMHPLKKKMNFDLLISPDSDVWLVMDQPLSEIMKWLEYDPDLDTLCLVSASGRIQDLGMKIPAPMKKYLRAATEVALVYQGDHCVNDMSVIPLVSRDMMN